MQTQQKKSFSWGCTIPTSLFSSADVSSEFSSEVLSRATLRKARLQSLSDVGVATEEDWGSKKEFKSRYSFSSLLSCSTWQYPYQRRQCSRARARSTYSWQFHVVLSVFLFLFSLRFRVLESYAQLPQLIPVTVRRWFVIALVYTMRCARHLDIKKSPVAVRCPLSPSGIRFIRLFSSWTKNWKAKASLWIRREKRHAMLKSWGLSV